MVNAGFNKYLIEGFNKDFYVEKINNPEIALKYNLALTKSNNRPESRTGIYDKIEKKGFDKTIKGVFKRYFIMIKVRDILGDKTVDFIKKIARLH